MKRSTTISPPFSECHYRCFTNSRSTSSHSKRHIVMGGEHVLQIGPMCVTPSFDERWLVDARFLPNSANMQLFFTHSSCFLLPLIHSKKSNICVRRNVFFTFRRVHSCIVKQRSHTPCSSCNTTPPRQHDRQITTRTTSYNSPLGYPSTITQENQRGGFNSQRDTLWIEDFKPRLFWLKDTHTHKLTWTYILRGCECMYTHT